MEDSSSNPTASAEGLPAASSTAGGLAKTVTNSTALQNALDVRIDVKGAYIVDEENPNEEEEEEWKDEEDYQHDSSDIRLPHHHNVVSHMAIDVRLKNNPHFSYLMNPNAKMNADWGQFD